MYISKHFSTQHQDVRKVFYKYERFQKSSATIFSIVCPVAKFIFQEVMKGPNKFYSAKKEQKLSFLPPLISPSVSDLPVGVKVGKHAWNKHGKTNKPFNKDRKSLGKEKKSASFFGGLMNLFHSPAVFYHGFITKEPQNFWKFKQFEADLLILQTVNKNTSSWFISKYTLSRISQTSTMKTFPAKSPSWFKRSNCTRLCNNSIPRNISPSSVP